MAETEFHRLRASLLKEGKYYNDPSFQAIPQSIYYSKHNPFVRWRRPTELCYSPKFVVEAASRFDLDQGSIGNCWYIAGVATLATRPQLFKRVVPNDQGFGENYAGIFHFFFWRFGEWVEVIIDDKLPTVQGKLCFCMNREEPDEFWSALLEKAYAKLHGSYEALEGGWTEDALVDFTGGIGQRYDLADSKKKPPDNFFDILCHFQSKGSMMGSCIFATQQTMESVLDNGLVIGHAYSITKLQRINHQGKSEELLRLRNPWGQKEWKGRWSDRSREWQSIDDETKKKLGLTIEEDGEFWMSYDDWMRNFEQMQICHLSPDVKPKVFRKTTDGKVEWIEKAFDGAWIRGVSAGGCGNPPYQHLYWNNPQYSVTLKSTDPNNPTAKSWMTVSLMQKYSRAMRTSMKVDDTTCSISFDLYKVKDSAPPLLEDETYSRHALELTKRGTNYHYFREVTQTFHQEPGTYVIIPSTFNVDVERSFLLRIYCEAELEGSELDVTTGPIREPSEQQKDAIGRLFHKYCGPDNAIDAKELRALLNEGFATELTAQNEFELESCRSLLAMMDHNRTGILEYEEVRRMWTELTTWQNTFNTFDKDKSGYISVSELKNIFKSVGYRVSRGVLEPLVRRYGGRHAKLAFDDFVIAMSKVIALMDAFGKVADRGKAELDLEQFMRMTLSY